MPDVFIALLAASMLAKSHTNNQFLKVVIEVQNTRDNSKIIGLSIFDFRPTKTHRYLVG
jgi:hypothetical protein